MTRRGSTGHYKITSVGGEQVQAFIPHPLPPDPPVSLSNARQRLLERATLALGRLDSITLLLPDPNIFLYAYVRREAVLSQIEVPNPRSPTCCLRVGEAPGVPSTTWWNWHGAAVRDLASAVQQADAEMHQVLLAEEREKAPGEFGRTQNWTAARIWAMPTSSRRRRPRSKTSRCAGALHP